MSIWLRLSDWLKKLANKLEEKAKADAKTKGIGKPREQFVFKPAQRYEMYVIGHPRTVYKGRIEDVEDDRLILSAPVERGVPVFLPKGTKVMLVIVGLPSGRYEFETEIISFSEENAALPRLVLRKPTVIYRKQRRAKPRARVYFRVRYRIVESTLKREVKMPLYGRVDAWDLSALGIALLFPDELPLHTRVRIDFVIPDMGIPVRAVAEVVNTRWEEFSRKYITGLLFLDILEEDRAHIDKYVSILLPKQVDGFIV